MPILHKPAAAQPESPRPEPGANDAFDLLAQMMALADQRNAADLPQSKRAGARRGTAAYDQFVTRAATGIGLLVCAAAWFIGAFFTVSWLAALGFGWAVEALAPLAGIVPGVQQSTQPTTRVAWLIWLLPLGITLAEIGFDPGRTNGTASRLLWGIFLITDATTTALGVYPALVRSMGDGLSAGGLATCIGLLLALVPEKLARRLIRENG